MGCWQKIGSSLKNGGWTENQQYRKLRGSGRCRAKCAAQWESVMSTNKIISEINAEQMTKEITDFAPGDTVVVQVKVK